MNTQPDTSSATGSIDTAVATASDIASEDLIEEVSIDGMCGVY